MLYDVHEKLIKSLKEISSNKYTLSTKNISKGLYFVAIFDSEGRKAVKKVILI